MNIWKYIKNNLVYGLLRSPRNVSSSTLMLLPFFIIFSLLFGFHTEVLQYKPIIFGKSWIFLPITLFILPSVIEEILFRGLLIPISSNSNSLEDNTIYVIASTFLFVLWHPINAVINPVSAKFFLNPNFLIIVSFLGIVCSVSYITSKSLWVPILIHWATVLVWVLLLGGRNLILD